MKKILTGLLAFAIVASSLFAPSPVFGVRTDAPGANQAMLEEPIRPAVVPALAVCSPEAAEKIAALTEVPFYTTISEGEEAPDPREGEVLLARLRGLGGLSGDNLDRQISLILESRIRGLLRDPAVEFTQEAEALVRMYCPDELDRVLGKQATRRFGGHQDETAGSIAAAAVPLYQYNKVCSQSWYGFLNVLIVRLTLNIYWGYNPTNGGMGNCAVASRTYSDTPGYSSFMKWQTDYIHRYNYYAVVYQEAYILYLKSAGGLNEIAYPALPAITVVVHSNGDYTISKNTIR